MLSLITGARELGNETPTPCPWVHSQAHPNPGVSAATRPPGLRGDHTLSGQGGPAGGVELALLWGALLPGQRPKVSFKYKGHRDFRRRWALRSMK